MRDIKKYAIPISRRRFGALLAATGAAVPAFAAQQNPPQTQQVPVRPAGVNAAPAQQAPPSSRQLPPEPAPFDAPLQFSRNDIALRAKPFPMNQVRLLPGSMYYDAQEWNRGYMSRLTADRLLYNFRANAGIPVGSAQPLGGWEQPDNGQRASELRGHFTGHFLSASALLYASTGDNEARSKADYMVAELAKCQEKLGGKYLSAFPTSFWDRLAAGERVWAPFYTIHKIMAGLFDMYSLADNKQALQVLQGMAAWADEWSGPKSEEDMQRILRTEYGGIAETMYNLAAATNDERWARVGDRYQKKVFINPLAQRRDELRGLHVNTHVPQVIAAARRYEISGDMRFHDVADFFFYEVSSARSYVTTGTSNGESWQVGPRRLAAELPRSISTAECCCSYNMLKLARKLYSWKPDPAYFDYYERSLLNMRIGTIQPKTGHTQYYLSLTPGAWKTFNSEDQSFWCCTGSGVEEYAKLNDSIYWHDAEGLYVNLFVPSELSWAEKGFKLRQETKFPEAESTLLTIAAAKPQTMSIRLRVPAWLKAAPVVKLNGKVLDASAAPGSYLTIRRTWSSGDKLEMQLEMHLYAEAMPDDRQMRAFLYGPLVLAADLGNEGLTPKHVEGTNTPAIQRPGARGANPRPDAPAALPAIEMPALRAASADPESFIKPAGKPLTFKTTGQQRDLTLAPINGLFDRRYSVYFKES